MKQTSAARREPTARTRGTRGDTTLGPANARTRIVGRRDDAVADLTVAAVRLARTLRARLRAAGAAIRSVVTPLGWTVLIVCLTALSAGYLFGWRELVVAGWACAALIVIAAFSLFGRTPFSATLTLPHPRVVVGDPAHAVIAVTSRYRRLAGVKIEVPVGDRVVETVIPGLSRGAAFEHPFPVPTERRGVLTVGPIRTVRADPLGLVHRELVWAASAELIVHPRTIAVAGTNSGSIRDLEGSPTRDLTASDVSFHALREYARGDERRHIHWKSTAKTGTFMVRQFEQTRRSDVLIALSGAHGDYADDAELELGVSVAGSLGVRAIRDVRNLTMITGESTPEFARQTVFALRQLGTLSPTRLLDDLAAFTRVPGSLPIAELSRVAADRVADVSIAFLVCGSPPTARQLRSAATVFPADARVIAVVCEPEAVPGLRQLAGLSVLTIGYLEDLQKALLRTAAA